MNCQRYAGFIWYYRWIVSKFLYRQLTVHVWFKSHLWPQIRAMWIFRGRRFTVQNKIRMNWINLLDHLKNIFFIQLNQMHAFKPDFSIIFFPANHFRFSIQCETMYVSEITFLFIIAWILLLDCMNPTRQSTCKKWFFLSLKMMEKKKTLTAPNNRPYHRRSKWVVCCFVFN